MEIKPTAKALATLATTKPKETQATAEAKDVKPTAANASSSEVFPSGQKGSITISDQIKAMINPDIEIFFPEPSPPGPSASDPAVKEQALTKVKDPKGVISTLDDATKDAFATAEAIKQNRDPDVRLGSRSGSIDKNSESGLSVRSDSLDVDPFNQKTYTVRNILSDGRVVDATYVSSVGALVPGNNLNDLVSVTLQPPGTTIPPHQGHQGYQGIPGIPGIPASAFPLFQAPFRAING